MLVVGYPVQSDREIDLMYENESARLWEEMNQNEAWNKMLDAVGRINVAIEHLDEVSKLLCHAKDDVEGIPAEDRVGSLLEQFEELTCDLKLLRQKFINGEG